MLRDTCLTCPQQRNINITGKNEEKKIAQWIQFLKGKKKIMATIRW